MNDPEISELTNAQLLSIISAFGHDVPPVYIDELYARGPQIEDELIQLLDQEALWQCSEDEDAYWMPVHVLLALGRLTSERAGLAIVNAIRKYAQDGFEILDWVASFWGALLRNKPDSVLNSFAPMILDKGSVGYLRLVGVELAAMAAQRAGAEALDTHLKTLAGLVADTDEELELRQQIASQLLDFPRAAYRVLVEQLADVRSEHGVMYTQSDVLDAYARGRDTPQWERLDNPWAFYSEEAVQARYLDDDDLSGLEEMLDEDLDADFDVPFVREMPKIGRNDPCPCGSGKKYKKCCMR